MVFPDSTNPLVTEQTWNQTSEGLCTFGSSGSKGLAKIWHIAFCEFLGCGLNGDSGMYRLITYNL